MIAGSEAYVGALNYYNSVKFGAKVNGAKVISEIEYDATVTHLDDYHDKIPDIGRNNLAIIL